MDVEALVKLGKERAVAGADQQAQDTLFSIEGLPEIGGMDGEHMPLEDGNDHATALAAVETLVEIPAEPTTTSSGIETDELVSPEQAVERFRENTANRFKAGRLSEPEFAVAIAKVEGQKTQPGILES